MQWFNRAFKILSVGFEIVKVAFTMSLIPWQQGISSILLNTIAHDSVFSSIDYIIEKINPKSSLTIYRHGIVDRYLYYLVINITGWILDILFWSRAHQYIYWLIMITTIPWILNRILEDPICIH